NSSLRSLLHEKANAAPKDLFSAAIHPGLKKASSVIEALIAAVPNLTLQHLFEKIIREAGVLNHIMQSDDKHWQFQELTGLFEFVKEETHRNASRNLAQLVKLIGLMEREDIRLPVVQVSGRERGVKQMTAHGTKGLEFEYV